MYTPGRRRFVFEEWPRDPNGPMLNRPPPGGKRTPNHLIWGADLDSFFWTSRIPGANILCVWTRSMIQDFGENYFNIEGISDFEPDPYIIPPYPLLQLVEPCDVDEGKDDSREHTTDDKEGDPAGLPSSSPTSNTPMSASAKPFDGLPKLEEFIPEEYYPDVLIVHDPDKLTPGIEQSPRPDAVSDDPNLPTVEYKRLWPKSPSDPPTTDPSSDGEKPSSAVAEPRVAHLHMSAKCLMGMGHHSLVYRAALTLPPPLTADSPTGQVTVAAKLAVPRSSARDMLRNEADIYNKMPKHLMEDWSGYNLVTPHKYPVPADAVVPKFFGFYVPVNPRSKYSAHGLSPILLIEECGEPIDIAALTPDERSQCYTHILRLHYEEVIQNSVYTRNITVQPGPLSKPPSKRSLRCPSFRIIDFGRGERLSDWFKARYGEDMDKADDLRNSITTWKRKKMHQEKDAQRELEVDLVFC